MQDNMSINFYSFNTNLQFIPFRGQSNWFWCNSILEGTARTNRTLFCNKKTPHRKCTPLLKSGFILPSRLVP
jgi:hypothetical protein